MATKLQQYLLARRRKEADAQVRELRESKGADVVHDSLIDRIDGLRGRDKKRVNAFLKEQGHASDSAFQMDAAEAEVAALPEVRYEQFTDETLAMALLGLRQGFPHNVISGARRLEYFLEGNSLEGWSDHAYDIVAGHLNRYRNIYAFAGMAACVTVIAGLGTFMVRDFKSTRDHDFEMDRIERVASNDQKIDELRLKANVTRVSRDYHMVNTLIMTGSFDGATEYLESARAGANELGIQDLIDSNEKALVNVAYNEALTEIDVDKKIAALQFARQLAQDRGLDVLMGSHERKLASSLYDDVTMIAMRGYPITVGSAFSELSLARQLVSDNGFDMIDKEMNLAEAIYISVDVGHVLYTDSPVELLAARKIAVEYGFEDLRREQEIRILNDVYDEIDLEWAQGTQNGLSKAREITGASGLQDVQRERELTMARGIHDELGETGVSSFDIDEFNIGRGLADLHGDLDLVGMYDALPKLDY
jgi:hypothetical protein